MELVAGDMSEQPLRQDHVPRVFRVLVKVDGVQTRDILIYPDHSPLSILHDYLKSCKFQMSWLFGTAQSGHAATVIIEGMAYATGYGFSKMAAKQQACKESLMAIIPHIKKYWEDDKNDAETNDDLDALDVSAMSRKLNQPYPSKCLEICLKRNYGLGGLDINKLETIYSDTETGHGCTLTINGLIGQGAGYCKKTARDLAAYSLLMKLHPVLQDFPGILRLYGNSSSVTKYLATLKVEEQTVLNLAFRNQGPAPVNEELLAKLRVEMRKSQKNSRQ